MKLFAILLPVGLAFFVDLLIYEGSMQSQLLQLLLRVCEDRDGEQRWQRLLQVLKKDDVQMLKYDDTVMGAESFLQDPDGGVYTGLPGRIVKLLSDSEYEDVACLDEGCGDLCSWRCARTQHVAAVPAGEMASHCSRPLGMRFAFSSSASASSLSSSSQQQRALFVCDAIRGVLRVPVESLRQKMKSLQKHEQPKQEKLKQVQGLNRSAKTAPEIQLVLKKVDDRRLFFSNALEEVTIDGKELLLLTDSSKAGTVGQAARILTETTGSGRLIVFDPATGEAEVVLHDLAFPNGLALTSDRQAVLLVEGGSRRILKYYLSGPRAGKSETVATDLPIIPDNITPLPDGSGFLLAGAVSRKVATLLPTSASLGQRLLHAAGARLFNWIVFDHLKTIAKVVNPLLQINAINAAAEWFLSKVVTGGHILVLGKDLDIKRWIALPRGCAFTSEAVVAHWGKNNTATAASVMRQSKGEQPAAKQANSDSFVLVGSFRSAPPCKLPLNAVLLAPAR